MPSGAANSIPLASRAQASDQDNSSPGLTSDEAKARLAKYGPNAMPDATIPAWRMALAKFWAPVPWMLEAAIILQAALHEYVQAAVIAGLLVFNAVLGFFQEGRAQATLAALKSRLALTASVERDGGWKDIPATELVPGDRVKLSLGGVVAADVKLVEGSILLDQSMLTGESIPIEAGPGLQTYAGALVRRGEATAIVTATGASTKFGHTAELVRTAHVESTQQKTVVRVVRNLAIFNGVIIVMLVAYAHARKMPIGEIIPLVLTAVLASIPVALPATFTLAAALGAKALGRLGVLPTRLSAVDEAATLDVLCSDKTGTLTRNELAVTTILPELGFDEARVLGVAALASSEGGQDPVDTAIRSAATKGSTTSLPKLIKFVPFDSATKMSEAMAVEANGGALHAVKGAFAAVIKLTEPEPTAAAACHELDEKGLRVLAFAVGTPTPMRLAGMIALSDQPRSDAAEFIKDLKDLGVRTVMLTGDAPATAAIIARTVGLDGAIWPPGPIPETVRPENFAVFAGVLPEDKYHLVEACKKTGHTVGMCGDGANDAPALRQAQMGIAVSTATDVAKSAAGIVLTEPGLGGIVAAVHCGRVAYQRILTYTLRSVTAKVNQMVFLTVGLIITGHAILTPMLIVLLLISGDFLAMSATTDHVRPSPAPNAWRIGQVTAAAVGLGLCNAAFCTAVLIIAHFHFGIVDHHGLRTLAALTLVFSTQAAFYVVRERRHLWSSRPSGWIVLSSLLDVAIIAVLAGRGILMHALPWSFIGAILLAAALFALILDLVKSLLFARLRLA